MPNIFWGVYVNFHFLHQRSSMSLFQTPGQYYLLSVFKFPVIFENCCNDGVYWHFFNSGWSWTFWYVYLSCVFLWCIRVFIAWVLLDFFLFWLGWDYLYFKDINLVLSLRQILLPVYLPWCSLCHTSPRAGTSPLLLLSEMLELFQNDVSYDANSKAENTLRITAIN